MSDIVVHHLEHSRSHRVLWLLEELELPYTLQIYARDSETLRAPATLKALHPLGKAPLVSLGDAVLAESGAIVSELLERFGNGRLEPRAGSRQRGLYHYFMHYAEGSLMPPLLVQLITNRVRAAKAPFPLNKLAQAVVDRIDGNFTLAELDRHGAFLDDHFKDRSYCCGDEFTAADIQLSYPLEVGLGRGLGDRPHLSSYLARLRERPAYCRALDRGGPVVL